MEAHMQMPELKRRLRQQGCQIVKTQVNHSGQHVHLIKHGSGWSLAMFQSDAADFVRGRATIETIKNRNRGADLADPWPIFDETRD
jgi:hypothetical protein